MSRPIGVTVTVLLMAVFLAQFVRVALASSSLGITIGFLTVAIVIGVVVAGLWSGAPWACQAFRWLLIAAAVLSFTLLLIGSKRHGPLYYAGRSLVMGAWAYYFFRPKVVAYFRPPMASS
jgi:hypothetical protein